jgi:DNA-binding MarR family transcriptional regulator
MLFYEVSSVEQQGARDEVRYQHAHGVGTVMDAVTRLANDTWEALFRAQATLAREFEFEGNWGGLPTREYGVLYALAGASEGVRITDLMGDALLTQAGVSRLVARLEKRGLVARRDDPSDARACRIVLTSEGHDVQRRVGRHHARHVSTAMTRALTRAQQETLRDLSRALIAACPTPDGQAPTTTPGTSGPTTQQTRR